MDNGSTFVKVDRIYNKRDNSPALLFIDDGGGMDPDGIRKCMSLGYSTKKGKNTIGQYGNGFKTSTMRLGADVIVFSRASRNGQVTQSVGLLSYTFRRRSGQDDVIVPMIDFDVSRNWPEPILYGTPEDWYNNLKIILEWSPFDSRDYLIQQFEDIGPHGTKIIIYNLWLNDEGVYELNFDEDDEDIKLRDESAHLSKLRRKEVETQAHISYRLLHSLRAYASVLYLRKFNNFKTILRGKPVEQYNIADDLVNPQVAIYKPHVSSMKEVVVEAKLGFIKEAPAIIVNGFCVYHKNRLIRPFWKVTKDGSSKGFGVVGVLEANFIEPAHDKQDFERSFVFSRLETKLKQMQMDYWKQYCHLAGHPPDPSYVRKQQKTADQVSPSPARAANPRLGLSGSQMGPTVGPPPGFQTASLDQDVACEDDPRTFDDICEENIQLYMRSEQLLQRETELKAEMEDLEKQIAETKMKSAELAAHIDHVRRQAHVR
ncbi:protein MICRORCHIDIA 2-like [Bidens hawaiensis]|uniref:protein MICRORCHIDIA 2-like n=1 Tax=Bidens hawaiensis TaxID=980011 RepID=UPI00404B7577